MLLRFNGDTLAYRGYLIRYSQTYGQYHVSKDGFHVTTVASEADARKAIDELVA